jgi:hypothetical protein
MEKIVIADKTFRLYKGGSRTFIHVPRDEKSLALKESLKYGNAITLINKDTNEELLQTFWFIFDFEENDRFLILVFQHSAKEGLFYVRRQTAHSITKYDWDGRESISLLSKTQQYSYSMLMCYSALFFVNATNASPGITLYFYDGDKKITSQYFLIVDVLRLRRKNGDWFEVSSLFPINFFHI